MPWPQSLWAATADPASRPVRLEGDHVADVAIIGGGYTGLSAARSFAQRGMRPAIVEANEIGWGASGRNGGVVSAKFRAPIPAIAQAHGLAVARRMAEIGHEGVDEVTKLIEEFDITSAAFSMSGNLRCAHNSKALDALVAEAEIMRDTFGDASLRILSGGEVAEETGSNDFVGGVLAAHAGVIHPLNLARGIACGLRQKNIDIFEHSPAFALERTGDGVLIKTPNGALRARYAVLATNAYSDLTDATSPVAQTLVPFRSAIIATEPLGRYLDETLMPARRSYSETRRMMRWFRRAGSRMIFGGRGAFGRNDSAAAFEALRHAMIGLFPQLQDVAVTHRWSGLVAMTLRSVPHVGRIDDRISYAMGYNGAGIACSCLMGRYICDLALGGKPDLALLAPERLPTIPFHLARKPAVRLVAGWYQFLDRIGL
ncbi:NAD(P)/FAD-dependent oxidoreductase [Mesorhizobium sp. A623]